MNTSEVAQLRQRIQLELEALQGGMTGYAHGTARHDFIRTRMERIGTCQAQLAEHVGENIATQVVYTLYTGIIEGIESDHCHYFTEE